MTYSEGLGNCHNKQFEGNISSNEGFKNIKSALSSLKTDIHPDFLPALNQYEKVLMGLCKNSPDLVGYPIVQDTHNKIIDKFGKKFVHPYDTILYEVSNDDNYKKAA